jgi:hypothetical protein
MSAQTIFSDLSPRPPPPASSKSSDHESVLDRAAAILWKACGIFERHQNENRRHSERGPDPDYTPSSSLHIGAYHERPPSWQKWILNVVAGVIVTGIPALIYEMSLLDSRLASMETRQADIQAESAQRMKAVEDRTLRLEGKVFH